MKYAVDREEETEVRGGRRLGRAVSAESPDTEITLGTRSLLGIFFGLVLICGVFFGLGYSVGRVSARGAAQTVGDTASAIPATSLAKPSPQEATTEPAAAPAATDGTTAVIPVATGAPGTASAPGATTPAAAVFPSNPVSTPAAAPVVVPAVQKTVAPTAGTVMVQVAAVSIAQDADILVAALRQRGYNAAVRHEPGDQLLHIQVGPFANRGQAEAMRQRLLADGYNAVLR